ncbi:MULTISPECIES: RidA family protein [Carnobacterium]|uniref:Endoribonuclease L-PSP family protein n=3 Tax=Carnobacterium maltaromaticum TaxID=2751 RepID=K8E448_CARML|nr:MULTISPECIES: RidA family protein [Carnobacterium]AOA02032.1 enamine deaminase RidA [Carnobacterium maltaromaticum]MBC9787431.1 RidA family protein [Carnobacterium maltaromaticum]MBQ6484093.1 RidA family protein [Carnobacterium sp.]MCC4312169.1 L-PSP family endoribonuclease [Carnobacterium maltaromaticum]MCI1819753.1 RidA family protein [Carnobacterium maltaromaticum]
MNTIIRKNPRTMPAPVGEYSHVTIVPKNSTLYTFSGQIGTDLSGFISEDHEKQVEDTFKNIERALLSEELTSDNIIKVNVWSVDEINWDHFYDMWGKLFSVNPSMTIAYVTALGLPEIKIEIEILAAKPE